MCLFVYDSLYIVDEILEKISRMNLPRLFVWQLKLSYHLRVAIETKLIQSFQVIFFISQQPTVGEKNKRMKNFVHPEFRAIFCSGAGWIAVLI